MQKIDVLSREAFVEQLVQLVESVSKNRQSVTFAIDGKWGCGKSFVLDMFADKLPYIHSDETNEDKFFLIKYNCWQYDYYEEPLVAIVASILETIDEKTHMVGADVRTKLYGLLKAAGATFLNLQNTAIKNATGIDVKATLDVVKNGMAAGTTDYEKMNEYDVYFSFKKALSGLKTALAELGEKYTVILLIDELDRCIPEYAIKVLERLHHLTEDTENIINIISVDKTQLQASIQKTFGFETPEEYLKKFIRFTMPLNIGVISDNITEKYADYIALFDKELFSFPDSVEEFMQAIFKDIDARTQEQLVDRAKMVHELLCKEKKDYSFMCMELLLTVLICYHNNNACFDKSAKNLDFGSIFNSSTIVIKKSFTRFFEERFKSITYTRVMDGSDKEAYKLPDTPLLYGAILYSWYWMNDGWKGIKISIPAGKIYEPIKDNYKELKEFAKMIRNMKA